MVDGLGRPVDGLGLLPNGADPQPIKAPPPAAANRARVAERIETGVRTLDLFVPLCRGQRLGLFAGSGVGKSVLLSMLARWTQCDVAVIGLIGERGREVQEFIEDDLGPEGMARSVVVVATSDEPALMRRRAAWTTLAVAEHFRDQGLNVLCLMDSVTRFAMAQREIGLASGEPPATKGYTPTVFAELPRLLERAGPGAPGKGMITGLFTVLVDGDDHNEPVADAVRGILDGHVVMRRAIAERGRYPAIDILKSVSRTLPHCMTDAQERHSRRRTQAVVDLFRHGGDGAAGRVQGRLLGRGRSRSGARPADRGDAEPGQERRGQCRCRLRRARRDRRAEHGDGGRMTPFDTALRVQAPRSRHGEGVDQRRDRDDHHARPPDPRARDPHARERALAATVPIASDAWTLRMRAERARLDRQSASLPRCGLSICAPRPWKPMARCVRIEGAADRFKDEAERAAAGAEQAMIDDIAAATLVIARRQRRSAAA